MTLAVVWSRAALDDITEIARYVATDNPAAADHIVDRVFEAAKALGDHPLLFRSGRVAGTREMVVLPTYLLIYRVEIDRVLILSVLHSSRRYPP